MSWPVAFISTVAIELACAVALARGEPLRRLALDIGAFNLVTHPLLWLGVQAYGVPVFVAEVGVVLVEYALYRGVSGLSARRAATLAVVANVASASAAWLV